MSGPCKNCEKRVLGCHATCENYNEYKLKNEELKKKKFLDKGVNNYIYDERAKRAISWWKHSRRRNK